MIVDLARKVQSKEAGDKLNELKARLRDLEELVKVTKRNADLLGAELKLKADQMNASNVKLQEKQTMIRELKLDLEASNVKMQVKQATIRELKLKMEDQQRELVAGNDKLQEQKTAICNLKLDLKVQKRELEMSNDKLTEKLKEKQRVICVLELDLEDRKRELEASNDESKEQQTTIRELTLKMKDQKSELEASKIKMEEQQTKIRELDSEVKAFELRNMEKLKEPGLDEEATESVVKGESPEKENQEIVPRKSVRQLLTLFEGGGVLEKDEKSRPKLKFRN